MALLIGDKTFVKGYHAQEYRPTELTKPIRCFDKSAWLGLGFYFWLEVIYAHYWGQDKKSFGELKSYLMTNPQIRKIKTVEERYSYYYLNYLYQFV